MSRGIPADALQAEWQDLPKNWYNVYQWARTSGDAYLAWIARAITESMEDIELGVEGLRLQGFRVSDHRGQAELKTDPGADIDTPLQLNEKRLVRAMFNLGDMPLLGKVVDYEVPLKASRGAAFGDVDLLCSLENDCLCVEAKQPDSSESILKPVIQAFTYTMLLATRKEKVVEEFKLDARTRFVPAILTFATALSGKKLSAPGSELSELKALVEKLNVKLIDAGCGPMRFFVVTNSPEDLKNCLVANKEVNGDVKLAFRSGFTLAIEERFVA